MEAILIYPNEDDFTVVRVALVKDKKERAKVMRALRAFQKHDDAYMVGNVTDETYQPLEEFLETRGVELVNTEQHRYPFE